MGHSRWAPIIQDDVWKPPPGSRVGATQEQDLAAGGRERRILSGRAGDREVLASIRLQRFEKGRRIYAYLNAKSSSRNFTVYVGEARGATRGEMLANAWSLALRAGKLSKLQRKIDAER